MLWKDFILLIAFPLTPFVRNGSTSAENFKLFRITVISWMETSFSGTKDSVLETESSSAYIIYEQQMNNVRIEFYIIYIH